MRILSIGECMAELAPADTAGDFKLGFAGDTFNTAWYLAQLAPESDVAYFTAVGDDTISQDMRAFMQSSGIDDSPILTISDHTIGLYMISLNNGERSFSYWRGQSAARQMANDVSVLENVMGSADVIFFSGITLAILDTKARETFFQAIKVAREKGKTIAFDPNLRPRLWASANEMTDVIMKAAGHCDIALPSFEDENTWFTDKTPEDTAQRYTSSGASTVVVKNGSAPVLFVDGDTSGEVTVAPVTDLIDTTAAGDSFNAGVLAGIAAGESLADSITQACQLARVVVQHKGALVPIPLNSLNP